MAKEDEAARRDELVQNISKQLAGYLERRSALAEHLDQQERIVGETEPGSYRAERAGNEINSIRAKLALYAAEIELLYSHLRRHLPQARAESN